MDQELNAKYVKSLLEWFFIIEGKIFQGMDWRLLQLGKV
jgi:hypothetical protein